MTIAQEYFFREGCFIEEWHNSNADEAMSVARVRVEVGKTTKLHALSETQERYVILAGAAEVVVGLASWVVEKGDVVVIPAGVPQKITNLGQQDLLFLAICTPRFKEQNYQELLE